MFYFSPDTPYFGFKADFDRQQDAFRIIEVAADSPAHAAGFEVGDYLIAEEGTFLRSWMTYYQNAVMVKAGVARKFLVKRGDKEIPISITPVPPLKVSPPKT